jgi:hypothetical protein
MAQEHLHETRERRQQQARFPSATPDRARDGGLVLCLWLVALLMAEVGFFLQLFEHAYAR